MLEAGQQERAIAHMDEHHKYISDALWCTEIRGVGECVFVYPSLLLFLL